MSSEVGNDAEPEEKRNHEILLVSVYMKKVSNVNRCFGKRMTVQGMASRSGTVQLMGGMDMRCWIDTD